MNRKEVPNCRRSWRCHAIKIDRLNDQENAARLGRWCHGKWGAIMPVFMAGKADL